MDAGAVALEVIDGTGSVIRKLDAPKSKGLHRVNWDLRKTAPPSARNQSPRRRFGRSRGGPRVRPGIFAIRLTVDGVAQTQTLDVQIDPDHPDPSWITFQEEAELMEAELGGDEEEEHDR